MSLAARLIEWLLAPLLSIWLVSLGISFMSARNTVDTVLDDGLSAVSVVLMSEWEQRMSKETGEAYPSPSTRRWLNVAHQTPINFLIVDSRGVPVAGDSELQPFLRETVDSDVPLSVARVDSGFRRVEGFNTVLDNEVMRVVRQRFEAAGVTYTVGVVQSRERQAALLRVGMIHETLAQTATLVVAFYLLWYGLTYVAKPMETLKSHLDERRADDLRPLPEQLAPQEIAALIASINAMMERLQTSLGAQKRFIANAAHQLRTPLAALRTQSELLARMPDGPERDQSMQRLIATGERTSHLAAQLLTLVRAESAGTTGVSQDIDLNALCESIAHDVLPQALARDIEFAFERSAAAVATTGDPTLIGEMIRNLLDNAFKYAPHGGSVVLAVHADPPRVRVDDSGPGIADSEKERIFAPFARVPQTDAVTGMAIGGTGLGLAIVREVAEAHDARVAVERAPLGGARFVVSFVSGRRQSAVSAET